MEDESLLDLIAGYGQAEDLSGKQEVKKEGAAKSGKSKAGKK